MSTLILRPELLDQVWDLLDRDGTSSISINEYTKLRPYMEAVKRGQAGLRYDGGDGLVRAFERRVLRLLLHGSKPHPWQVLLHHGAWALTLVLMKTGSRRKQENDQRKWHQMAKTTVTS